METLEEMRVYGGTVLCETSLYTTSIPAKRFAVGDMH